MRFGTAIRLTVVVLSGIVLYSCGVTRHIPNDKYLLSRNKIEVDKSVPKNERISASQISEYIHQSPNKRFLGTNLPLWLYQQANPSKDNWWNNMLRKVGEQPVFLDSTLTESSARNIKTYMFSRGFFNAKEDFSIDTVEKRKRAIVTYSGTQGKPYYVGQLTYQFRDKFLEQLVLGHTDGCLIKKGQIYNDATLAAERERITTFLRDRGYYDFTVNNITYVADSAVGNHTVNIMMVVHPLVSGYNDDGSPRTSDNIVYKIRNINVFPNYDPKVSQGDPDYLGRLDTLHYRGLNIIYDGKLRMRPKVLSNNIKFNPGGIYNSSLTGKTYANLISLGNYRTINILFDKLPEPTNAPSVTYFGGNLPVVASSTREGYLDCNILGTQTLRQGFIFEIEGSTTSTFYGLTATIGYQNRNLFRGAEQFDCSVTAGYEFLKSGTKRTSYELGASVGLSIPRFIFPGNIDRSPTVNAPKTRIALSVDRQDRAYYDRYLSTVNWAYTWNNGIYSSYTIRPIDVSLVKMGHIEQSFIQQLKNPYLINSYTSQLIAGISGQFVFNNQSKNINGNAEVLRLNLETTGNLIDGLTHLFGKESKDGYYKLFGIRYSQYVRGDLSFSQKVVFGKRSAFAYRLYGGFGYSYGNSSSLPFDRLFFAGGTNSMRGWVARTLGPGATPEPTGVVYPSQLGNMKLEANAEYRFKIAGIVYGAAFADVGNIWFLNNKDTDQSAGVFHFNTFYKQLGFDAGLGIRLDIKFAVLRLDWGAQIHNPNWPEGQRWIHNFKWDNMALNFGVGYPF